MIADITKLDDIAPHVCEFFNMHVNDINHFDQITIDNYEVCKLTYMGVHILEQHVYANSQLEPFPTSGSDWCRILATGEWEPLYGRVVDVSTGVPKVNDALTPFNFDGLPYIQVADLYGKPKNVTWSTTVNKRFDYYTYKPLGWCLEEIVDYISAIGSLIVDRLMITMTPTDITVVGHDMYLNKLSDEVVNICKLIADILQSKLLAGSELEFMLTGDEWLQINLNMGDYIEDASVYLPAFMIMSQLSDIGEQRDV
jgi:hypothetical protein